MKIAKITAIMGVLLAMAQMASSKGTQAGSSVTFDVSCDASDSCTVNAGGLTPGKNYEIQVFDNCSGTSLARDYTAGSGGVLSDVFALTGPYDGCLSGDNWSFYLYSYGSNGNRLRLVTSFQVKQVD